MPAQEERKKVLDMLAAGQINVDQASELLRALGDAPRVVSVGAPPPPPPPRAGTARLLRISIDADEDGSGNSRAKIRVNVPLGLAKFASRFLPAEARTELEAQGIDLNELINALSTETPEGKLVDIDVDENGRKGAKIVVEVI